MGSSSRRISVSLASANPGPIWARCPPRAGPPGDQGDPEPLESLARPGAIPALVEVCTETQVLLAAQSSIERDVLGQVANAFR